MNLHEEIEKNKKQGYYEDNAQSKLGQDIILKAIFDSGMAENATIKGGVVMRSISGEARRATQDLNLDFIRYSTAVQRVFAKVFYEHLGLYGRNLKVAQLEYYILRQGKYAL